MKIRNDERTIGAVGNWYELTIDQNEPLWADLRIEGRPLARLFTASGVDSSDRIDTVGAPGRWDVDEYGATPRFVASGASSVWKRKRYLFECADDWLAYSIELEGEGALQSVRFFEGFLRGTLDDYIAEPDELLQNPPPGRPLKQWLTGSVGAFDEVFNPEPVGTFRQWIAPFEWADLSVADTRPDAAGSWFFTPPPLCYCVRMGQRWVALGIAAQPGENNFLRYEYTGGELFGLRLGYDGYTHVDEAWKSPKLVLVVGDSEYEALERYVGWLREHGYVMTSQRAVPDWWRQPIVCGWGEQCALMHRTGTHPRNYASEPVYRQILDRLHAQRIPFGTLIIDDKWQERYGTNRPDPGKWPDLRGFIDKMAARDVRVLLWYNSWGCEGVPAEECIRKDGRPLVVDPTNPAYAQRLREQIRFMLSSETGCLNASGFKIDFTANIPKEPGCEIYEPGVWGIELLKRLMSIIYSAAKVIKPDALIITHTANAYFAETTDMLRLNDICSDYASVVPTMTHRARVARAACPEWLIDSDNYPLSHLPAWREYVAAQPALGVPSLYYITSLEAEGTEFGDAEYDLLRRTYSDYVNGLGALTHLDAPKKGRHDAILPEV